MPNWCKNNLSIKGNHELINEYLKQILDANKSVDFSIAIPDPAKATSGWYYGNWN